jgi:hypothetical protein
VKHSGHGRPGLSRRPFGTRALPFAVIAASLAALAALALSIPTGAYAQGNVIRKLDPAGLIALIKELGEPGTAKDASGGGSPAVMWETGGKRYLISVSGEGGSLHFLALEPGSRPSPSVLNAWNEGNPFTRAYTDDHGDAALVLDLSLSGGVTGERVKGFLKTCLQARESWSRALSAK